MNTKTQYSDIKGTATADVTDDANNSLQEYLSQEYEAYDPRRYYCHGCELYFGENGFLSVCYVCYDGKEKKYVGFSPKKELSYKEVFGMFKRFKVLLGDVNMEEIEVADELPL